MPSGRELYLMKNNNVRTVVFAAVFLALALVLPFLTGQIPQIGSMLSPMHIPVLLCGFVCGWPWAMPPMYPTALCMAFELATYGVVAGLMYRALPKKKSNIYVSLIVAMIAGRLVWGAARFLCTGLDPSKFGFAAFWAGAFTGAIPGIILHILLIPLLVMALERAKLISK